MNLKVVPDEKYSETTDVTGHYWCNTHSVSNPGKGPYRGRFSETEYTNEISDRFSEGLQDIEHSPFLILLYWLDRTNRTALKVIPPNDPSRREHGVFCKPIPQPSQPNRICVVNLLQRDRNMLIIERIDALDKNPFA
jgi:formylmethanofuran dehydrogenase subunit E